MSSPNVRVRLSAEGVEEVVAALRKIQAESTAAARGSARSFKGFEGALGGIRQMLLQVAAALSVASIIGFIKASAEAADNLGKMSQRIGASVENVSALAVGARTANVELEQLQQTLGKFAVALVDLRSGAPQAVQAFAALGLSARSFNGKDTVEAFEVVAKAMGRLRDSTDKTALAIKVFGRSGAQLIPLLNDVSEGGLARLKDRARELGLLFNDDLSRQVQQMNDDFALLAAQAQGVGAQFAAALSPDIRQAVKTISDSLSGEGAQSFREFAHVVGVVVRAVTALVLGVSETIRSLFVDLKLIAETVSASTKQLFKGDFAGAKETIDALYGKRIEEYRKSRDRLIKVFKDITAKAEAPGALRGGAQDTAANAADAFQQRAEVIKAALQNEVKLLQAKLALEDEAVREQYDEGLVSAREFYDKKLKIIETGANLEVAALLRQKAAAERITDPQKRQLELQRIDNDLALVNIRLNADRAKAYQEMLKHLRELTQRQIQFDQEAARRRGAAGQADLLGIDEQVRQFRATQIGLGTSPEIADEMVKDLRSSLVASAKLEDLKQAAELAMSDLLQKRQAIQDQVNNGQLGEIEGEQRLLELERARLPELEQIAQGLLAAAQATGNPEGIAFAEKWINDLRNVRAELDTTTRAIGELKRQAGDAFKNSLTQSLAAIGQEITTLQGFFQSFFASLLEGLQQIAAQQFSSSIFKFVGSALGFADGGYVRGSGGYRSDGIFAYLSPGEFVVNAETVAQPGMRGWLELANMWRGGEKPGGMGYQLKPIGHFAPDVSKFADGGYVPQPPQQVGGTIQVGLQDGLVLRALETPEGQKAIIKVINANRRGIRNSLG